MKYSRSVSMIDCRSRQHTYVIGLEFMCHVYVYCNWTCIRDVRYHDILQNIKIFWYFDIYQEILIFWIFWIFWRKQRIYIILFWNNFLLRNLFCAIQCPVAEWQFSCFFYSETCFIMRDCMPCILTLHFLHTALMFFGLLLFRSNYFHVGCKARPPGIIERKQVSPTWSSRQD